MPPGKGTKRKADAPPTRPRSTRASAERATKRIRETTPAGRAAGFVSGKGLTRVGVNKVIAQRSLNAAAAAERGSGSGAEIQRQLALGLARYQRAGMGAAVTASLLHAGSLSLAHNVPAQLAFRAASSAAEWTGAAAPGLRAAGVSRNHILADSSIASIAHEAMSRFDRGNAQHAGAINELFAALSGAAPDSAAAAGYLAAFRAAHDVLRGPDRPDLGVDDLHRIIDAIAVSPNNLVIADDARNTNQGARFDPVMDRRGLNRASQRIMDAVIGLQQAGLITPDLRQAVLSMARRTADAQYESSNTSRPVDQEDLSSAWTARFAHGAAAAAAAAAAANDDNGDDEDRKSAPDDGHDDDSSYGDGSSYDDGNSYGDDDGDDDDNYDHWQPGPPPPANVVAFLTQQGVAAPPPSLRALMAHFAEGSATRAFDDCLIDTMHQLAAGDPEVAVDGEEVRDNLGLDEGALDIHNPDEGQLLALSYGLRITVHRIANDGTVTQDAHDVNPDGPRHVHVAHFGGHFIPLWPRAPAAAAAAAAPPLPAAHAGAAAPPSSPSTSSSGVAPMDDRPS